VASETNTDRINRLEQNVVKLVTRVDALNFKTGQIEDRQREIEHFSKDLDKRLSLVGDRFERLKEDLDEIRTKRWEIGKIILTAVLSSALGLLVGRFLK
jgi:chromosome segregation ATPase